MKSFNQGESNGTLLTLNLCLTKTKKKNDEVYCSWSEILFSIHQGFVLSSLLANLFMRDLLVFPFNNIANYTDCKIPIVKNDLEQASDYLSGCFNENCFKVDLNKCHVFSREMCYNY